MRITTFKQDKYRDCPVYYRNFLDHFEYFAVIKGELYTVHFAVRPHWFTKILYKLGIERSPYSEKHLTDIKKQLRRMAEATIDFVLDKKVV